LSYRQYLITNRHRTKFYARITIPLRLRPYFKNRKEIRRSTGTNEKSSAKLIALGYYLHYQKLFRRVEGMTKKRPPVTGDEMLHLSVDGEITVMKYFDPVQKHPLDDGSFTTELITGKDAFGNDLEVDFGGTGNLEAAKFEAETLAQLQAQSHDKKLELINKFGNDPELLKAALGQLSTSLPPQIALPSNPMTFSEVADDYKGFRESNIRTGRKRRTGKKANDIAQLTYDEELPRIDLWQQHFDGQMVHEIQPRHIKEISEWLDYLPSRMKQKGISVSDAIAIAKRKKGEKIPASTYNKWATALRGLLQRAKDLGSTELDLKDSIECYDAKVNQDTTRLPFSDIDLNIIFPGPDYGKKYFGNRAGSVPQSAKFWLPLVAAFSGCRIEEIAQLTVSDVKHDSGTNIDYLRITNAESSADGGLKQAKHENSVRPLPVHSMLTTIGFSSFVADRARSGSDVSLFGLQRSTRGKYSTAASKYFSRKSAQHRGYLERCGIETAGTNADGSKWSKSFHSFRHNVSTILMGKGVPASNVSVVLGQNDENKFEATTYNHKTETDRLEMRQQIIEMIEYPSVNFGGISWQDLSKKQ